MGIWPLARLNIYKVKFECIEKSTWSFYGVKPFFSLIGQYLLRFLPRGTLVTSLRRITIQIIQKIRIILRHGRLVTMWLLFEILVTLKSTLLCNILRFCFRPKHLIFWMVSISGAPLRVFRRGVEKGGQWWFGYWRLFRDRLSHSRRACEGLRASLQRLPASFTDQSTQIKAINQDFVFKTETNQTENSANYSNF